MHLPSPVVHGPRPHLTNCTQVLWPISYIHRLLRRLPVLCVGDRTRPEYRWLSGIAVPIRMVLCCHHSQLRRNNCGCLRTAQYGSSHEPFSMGSYSRVPVRLFSLLLRCAVQRLERCFLDSTRHIWRPLVGHGCDTEGDETQCPASSACSSREERTRYRCH